MTATVVRATTFAFLMVYAAKGAETLHGLPSTAGMFVAAAMLVAFGVAVVVESRRP